MSSPHHPSTPPPPRSDNSAPNANAPPRPTQSIAELYAAIAKSRGTTSPAAQHPAAASASPSPLAALIGPIAAAAAAAAAASAASHSVAASSSPAIAAAAATSPAHAHAPAPPRVAPTSDRPPLQFSSVSHDEFSQGNKHNPWHSNSNTSGATAATSETAAGRAAVPARAASAAAVGPLGSSPRTASPIAATTASTSARPSPPSSSSSSASASASALSSSVFSTVGVYRSPLTSRPLVRTLVVALLALVGSRVKIELRNESTVRGVVESVDKQGNMAMVQASVQRQGEKISGGGSNGGRPAPPPLAFLFLPSRSIRFVHIPASVGDATVLLTNYEQRLDANLQEYQRKKRLGRYTSREAQLKNVAQKEARLAREIAAEEAAAAAAAAANDPAAIEAKKEETRRKQRESMAGGSSTWTPPVAATIAADSAATAASSAAAAVAPNPPDEESNKRRKI